MSRFCSNCGNEVEDGVKFCNNCGASVDMVSTPVTINNYANAQPTQTVKKDSKGTASMVCGIVGLFVAGIILGIIAIVEANLSKSENGGVYTTKAKAGLILGIIDVICVGLFLIMMNT